MNDELMMRVFTVQDRSAIKKLQLEGYTCNWWYDGNYKKGAEKKDKENMKKGKINSTL